MDMKAAARARLAKLKGQREEDPPKEPLLQLEEPDEEPAAPVKSKYKSTPLSSNPPTEKAEGGHRKVPVVSLEPNPWNPNRMSGALFAKLVRNVGETLRTNGSIPPVVVRQHPDDPDKFQIIDGFHRFKALKQLKKTDIDVFVMNVSDEAAKLLTGNLNYLRGEKDMEKYTTMLGELLDGGMSIEELSDFLPEDEADIADLITTYGDGETIRKLIEAQDSANAGDGVAEALHDDKVFVEVKFNVSISQAKVVQREIARIGKVLVGNNVEGRALEFMAVQSAQTELPPELAAAKEAEKAAKKAKKVAS